MTPGDPCAADFAEFFVELWGKRPFCWQKDLAKRVLECEAASADLPGVDAPSGASGAMSSSWPDAIALPTASGKTACMDIALFALAAQAARLDSGQAITTPRRIFFVVDRRVIVDEAYERARRLAEKLEQAVDGILKAVADDLRRIAHGAATGFGGERPLAVHVLRGGMYRSEAWARNPLQPTIVVSTNAWVSRSIPPSCKPTSSATPEPVAMAGSPDRLPSEAKSERVASTRWWTTSSARAVHWRICAAGSRSRAARSSARSG